MQTDANNFEFDGFNVNVQDKNEHFVLLRAYRPRRRSIGTDIGLFDVEVYKPEPDCGSLRPCEISWPSIGSSQADTARAMSKTLELAVKIADQLNGEAGL